MPLPGPANGFGTIGIPTPPLNRERVQRFALAGDGTGIREWHQASAFCEPFLILSFGRFVFRRLGVFGACGGDQQPACILDARTRSGRQAAVL